MVAKNDKKEFMFQILGALEPSRRVEDSLKDALQVIREMLGVEDVLAWFLDEKAGNLFAMQHDGENDMTGYEIQTDTGLAGQVITTGEQIWIKDTSGHPNFPGGKDEITGVITKNAYYAPIRMSEKTIGVLQLNNKPEGGYTESEISLINSSCALITMSIEEKGFSFSHDTDRNVIMSFRNIIKDYPSGSETIHVLKGVNLDIYENEFVVILGESGCGKSTMLNIIGGMDKMTSGNITIDGKDFSHPSERELDDYRRDYIGFVFQAYNLMPNLTALENVEYIAENCPSHGEPRAAIDMVGLSDRAGNYPSMMSGGQQQRVSIARAIVKNPRMILADEPTAALDFDTAQEVLRVIEKLVKENKTTVVMVTHNVEIAKMANRVVKFKAGRIESIRENAWPLSADDLVW